MGEKQEQVRRLSELSREERIAGSARGDSSQGGEKWSNSAYILQLHPAGFPVGLIVTYEGDSKVFSLSSNWKD